MPRLKKPKGRAAHIPLKRSWLLNLSNGHAIRIHDKFSLIEQVLGTFIAAKVPTNQ
jgi:hypothetical protein